MNHTVIILAHPNLDTSTANRIVAEQLGEHPHAKIRHLDALYPDFKIDVEAEQQALLEADAIVFQFPFFWYSVPGILKHWMDVVLSYGFAYGTDGDKLRGKRFIVSTTIGGPTDAYQSGGYNHYPIPELITPLKQTANLTGMTWVDPILSHSMIYIEGVYNVKEEVEDRARDHAARLTASIEMHAPA